MIGSQAEGFVGQAVQRHLSRDPQSRLRACHPQARPDCRAQLLSQRLLLQEPLDKLAAIAREFRINYHTLNWHWKHRALPLLRAIAEELRAELGDAASEA